MAIKRCEASINVVQAAEIRITNVFGNGLPVYFSFSGGKDSLVMAQLIVNLIQQGKINPKQLVVQFVDEEAIFPCIEKTVLAWRKRFLLLGAAFEWFCIEVKHYNCFNALSEDETFICWDSSKCDVWVRTPPTFAVRSHPKLRPRKDAYQDFMPRISKNGITIVGVRTAESVQRLQNIATMTRSGAKSTKRNQIFPIYDWLDADVWRFLKEQAVDIPAIYLYLWQSGSGKAQLRVSQFFSADTARSLVKMNEYYPDLMERVTRREPNAYLAAMYWDSEMFGKRSKNRRALEKGNAEIDYKAKLITMFTDMDSYFTTKHKRYIAERYRNFFLQTHIIATDKEFQDIYEGLVSGDPKLRAFRALYNRIYGRYVARAKKANREQGTK